MTGDRFATIIKGEPQMTKILTPSDIRDLLTGFAAAIELDQIRVDALPPESFSPLYDDESWRDWRRAHIAFIDHLLRTVDAMPSTLLQQLTQLAITYDPAGIGQAVRSLFGHFTIFEPTDETAAMFFDELVGLVSRESEDSAIGADARARLMQWLRVRDPLRIGEDPECGYGQFLDQD
jgi:hypothetical protein